MMAYTRKLPNRQRASWEYEVSGSNKPFEVPPFPPKAAGARRGRDGRNYYEEVV